MPDLLRRLRDFSRELKRRRVYRVGVAYVIVAAGALQLIDVLVPATRLPGWSEELLLALAIVGLPLVLVMAWMFDMTPSGVERTGDADGPPSSAPGESDATRELGPPGTETPPPPSPDGGPDGSPGVAVPDAAVLDADPLTIAVLPFADLSGSDAAAPFAAGLHDDLLTELSRISSLTVISRTSVIRYRAGEYTIREVAGRLGAGTVVEGSVRQVGDRVRLNVQLIDGRTDAHLWAERFDRELTASSIFDIQAQLARTIASVLHAELTPGERARVHRHPTEDLEAYRRFAQGRTALALRAQESLRQAADHFERALERDPGYAPAWAGLAIARILLADYGFGDEDELLPPGEEAARRALELDPELAEAHSALGNYFSATRRCSEALRSHSRAAELAPGYAQAHQWVCWVSLLMGDAHHAAAEGVEATRLNPLEPEAHANLAVALVGIERTGEALEEARRGQEDQEGFDYGRWAEGLALYHRLQYDEATRAMEDLTEPWARHWPEAARGLALARGGDPAGALAVADTLVSAQAPFKAALLAAAVGDADRTFELLADSHPTSWSECLYLRFPPLEPLGRLRGDPRWDELLRALDESWGVE